MADVPWFKFYPSDWLGGTRGLKPAEAGIYIHLLAMMYEKAAPLSEDVAKLARRCGTTASHFERSLEQLILDGKIRRTDGGLWNDRVEKEIENRIEKSSSAKHAANKRWEKDQEKQQPINADALQTQSDRNAIPESRDQKPESRGQSPEVRNQNPERKTLSRSASEQGSEDAEFNHFWRVYPRREAKVAARRAYEKARKSVSAEIILEGARQYAAERAYEDPKYTKHPATWLNGECWGDEPRQPHIIARGTGGTAGSFDRAQPRTHTERAFEMLARRKGE